jgi:hypothetical protein
LRRDRNDCARLQVGARALCDAKPGPSQRREIPARLATDERSPGEDLDVVGAHVDRLRALGARDDVQRRAHTSTDRQHTSLIGKPDGDV